MEMITENTNFESITDLNALPQHLKSVIDAYIGSSKYLSVSGFSKKCGVSEPTIRRILTGKIKTLPQASTVLDILSYISGETSARSLVEKYPGPIAEYLKDRIPQLQWFDPVYNPQLNRELENQVKYIIFKLSLNDSGVTLDKVKELYGQMGENYLNEMVQKGFIAKEGETYRSVFESFSADLAQFVNHFKATADFIKVSASSSLQDSLKPVIANYSWEVSKEQYKKIQKVQTVALAKIREILQEQGHEPKIPMFLLAALDTLDLKTAGQIVEDSDS